MFRPIWGWIRRWIFRSEGASTCSICSSSLFWEEPGLWFCLVQLVPWSSSCFNWQHLHLDSSTRLHLSSYFCPVPAQWCWRSSIYSSAHQSGGFWGCWGRIYSTYPNRTMDSWLFWWLTSGGQGWKLPDHPQDGDPAWIWILVTVCPSDWPGSLLVSYYDHRGVCSAAPAFRCGFSRVQESINQALYRWTWWWICKLGFISLSALCYINEYL